MGQFRASAEGLTLLVNSLFVLCLRSVSPFTNSRERHFATPDLLRPSRGRPFRQRSPRHRIAERFHRRLIGSTYRPSDGVGLHRSCIKTIFSRRQHATPQWATPGNPHVPVVNGSRGPATLHLGTVTGVPSRPKCRLPESLCLAPSTRRLLRTSRWRRTGCLPRRTRLPSSSREF